MKKLFTLICMTAILLSLSAFGEVVPIDIAKQVMDPVNESCFLSDTEYEDPSLHIVITSGRAYDTDYMVARIEIADPSQLRSAMVSSNGKSEENGATLAKRVNAVMAINGDYFRKFVPEYGKHIVRQGRVLKKNANKELDVLLIDDLGNFTILPAATEKMIEELDINIVNAYTFGPALVIDGELMRDIPHGSIGGNKKTQRICIAQTDPLQYMIVVCAGPENPGSSGMTINEFAETVYAQGNVQQAYNMDGGSSASLIFRGKKINTFGSGKSRSISDIIYFTSAWQEE